MAFHYIVSYKEWNYETAEDCPSIGVLLVAGVHIIRSDGECYPDAQRMMAVAKQLHLTPEQTKQLIPILQAQEPQLQAIMNDQSLSRMEKLRRLRAIHDQSNPQVKAILTPEQFQQLQIIRQQRRAQLMQAAKQSNQGQCGANAIEVRMVACRRNGYGGFGDAPEGFGGQENAAAVGESEGAVGQSGQARS